jgi:hypothetical protein
MSETSFESPLARLVAFETNPTHRPSPLIDGKKLAPFGSRPSRRRLTRRVIPRLRSRTKTWLMTCLDEVVRSAPGADPRSRGALEVKATYRPSALIVGEKLEPSLIWWPVSSTLTLVTTPVDSRAT